MNLTNKKKLSNSYEKSDKKRINVSSASYCICCKEEQLTLKNFSCNLHSICNTCLFKNCLDKVYSKTNEDLLIECPNCCSGNINCNNFLSDINCKLDKSFNFVITCESCELKTAILKCLNCKTNFCLDCFKEYHESILAFLNHTTIQLNSIFDSGLKNAFNTNCILEKYCKLNKLNINKDLNNIANENKSVKSNTSYRNNIKRKTKISNTIPKKIHNNKNPIETLNNKLNYLGSNTNKAFTDIISDVNNENNKNNNNNNNNNALLIGFFVKLFDLDFNSFTDCNCKLNNIAYYTCLTCNIDICESCLMIKHNKHNIKNSNINFESYKKLKINNSKRNNNFVIEHDTKNKKADSNNVLIKNSINIKPRNSIHLSSNKLNLVELENTELKAIREDSKCIIKCDENINNNLNECSNYSTIANCNNSDDDDNINTEKDVINMNKGNKIILDYFKQKYYILLEDLNKLISCFILLNEFLNKRYKLSNINSDIIFKDETLKKLNKQDLENILIKFKSNFYVNDSINVLNKDNMYKKLKEEDKLIENLKSALKNILKNISLNLNNGLKVQLINKDFEYNNKTNSKISKSNELISYINNNSSYNFKENSKNIFKYIDIKFDYIDYLIKKLAYINIYLTNKESLLIKLYLNNISECENFYLSNAENYINNVINNIEKFNNIIGDRKAISNGNKQSIIIDKNLLISNILDTNNSCFISNYYHKQIANNDLALSNLNSSRHNCENDNELKKYCENNKNVNNLKIYNLNSNNINNESNIHINLDLLNLTGYQIASSRNMSKDSFPCMLTAFKTSTKKDYVAYINNNVYEIIVLTFKNNYNYKEESFNRIFTEKEIKLRGHSANINVVKYNKFKGKDLLFSCSNDGTIKAWDCNNNFYLEMNIYFGSNQINNIIENENSNKYQTKIKGFCSKNKEELTQKIYTINIFKYLEEDYILVGAYHKNSPIKVYNNLDGIIIKYLQVEGYTYYIDSYLEKTNKVVFVFCSIINKGKYEVNLYNFCSEELIYKFEYFKSYVNSIINLESKLLTTIMLDRTGAIYKYNLINYNPTFKDCFKGYGYYKLILWDETNFISIGKEASLNIINSYDFTIKKSYMLAHNSSIKNICKFKHNQLGYVLLTYGEDQTIKLFK